MIETGLPYKIEEMPKICESGAIVDLSKIDFPNIVDSFNKVKTSMIYLRNTNFDNIKLKFDNVSKEDKFLFLEQYLISNIEFDFDIMATSWSKILNYAVGVITEAPCILTNEEIDEFLDNHYDMVKNALQLIISLPVFIIKRINTGDESINLDEYEKNYTIPIGINLKYLIKIKGILLLYGHEYEFEPNNYVELFNIENDELFEQLKNSDLGFGLFCLSELSLPTIQAIMSA